MCTYYFDAFSAATVFGNAIAIGMQADAEALGRRVEDLSAYEVRVAGASDRWGESGISAFVEDPPAAAKLSP